MADFDFGGAFLGPLAEAQRFDVLEERRAPDLAHLASITRLQNSQAGAAESRAAAEQKLSAILAGGIPEGSASNQMNYLAGAAAKAGAPQLAKDFMLRGVQIKTQEVRQATADRAARATEITNAMKHAELANKLYGGVESQQDLDKANLILSQVTGEEVPPQFQIYNPATIDFLRRASMNEFQRVKLEQAGDEAASRQADRRSRASYRALNYDIRRAAETRRTNAAADKAKLAGRDVGAPTKAEMEMAASMLSADKASMPADLVEAKNAAADIASRGRYLRKQNPALDATEAMQRAFIELKESGAFVTTPASGFFGKPKTSYARRGASAESAIELKSMPDASKLKEGNFYKAPGGTFQWKGGKPVRVTSTGVKIPVAPAADDDEGEEEDDEE